MNRPRALRALPASWAGVSAGAVAAVAVLVTPGLARAADSGAPAAPPAPSPAPLVDSAQQEDADTRGSVVMWPTLTPAGDDPSGGPLHVPRPAEASLYNRLQELDATLREGVQDLGFTLDVSDSGPGPGRTRDVDILERANHPGARGKLGQGTWVVSPRLETAGLGSYYVRIVVAAPGSTQLRVRVEKVTGGDVAARGLVMLRELLATSQSKDGVDAPLKYQTANYGVMSTLRSQGRAFLAVNGTIFGAYVAYSVQRASGSDDPRLLYPLLAIGAGAGIGVSLLAAEEWDIGTGDAWYLAAGAWWGAGSGLLLANGYDATPFGDRYSWGVGGGLAGLSLATFGLTRRHIDEGGAALAHSGAAAGVLFGGLADLAYRGTIEETPQRGAGYGAAVGLVAGGTLAAFADVSPSRVLLIDLGIGAGALVGAAAGSPLVFEDVTEGKSRGFVLATGAGALLGGGAAWLLTRDRKDDPSRRTTGLSLFPVAGPVPGGATVGAVGGF